VTLLDVDPGPYNRYTGVMPSEPQVRDGGHFWLIHGPTFTYAARCASLDAARALVLDKLCYSAADVDRLVDNLAARPATRAEVNATVLLTGRSPLQITKRNGRRLVSLMAALYRADVRSSGDMKDGGHVTDFGDLS